MVGSGPLVVYQDHTYNCGTRGRAGKRLSLTDDGRQLLDKAVVAWTWARRGLSDAMLPDGPVDDVGGVMARLAIAADAAAGKAGTQENRSEAHDR